MKKFIFPIVAAVLMAVSCSRSAEHYVHILPEVVVVSYSNSGLPAVTPEMAGRLVVEPVIDSSAVKAYDKLPVKPMHKDAEADEFAKELNRNAIYPAAARRAGHCGKTVVSFVVGKDGSVCNAKVLQSSWDELDKPVFNFVSHSKDWTPATRFGKPVETTLIMPINYQLR